MTKIKGKVVLLPTKQKAVGGELVKVGSDPTAWGIVDEGAKTFKSLDLKHTIPLNNESEFFYHLYIISDEEIQDGDWFYSTVTNNIRQNINNLIEEFAQPDIMSKIITTTNPSLNLPLIPQEFIKEYCENPVEDVWVEAFDKSDLIPIITPIREKKSWTRDEVVQLIIQSHIARNVMTDYYNELPIWINQNL